MKSTSPKVITLVILVMIVSQIIVLQSCTKKSANRNPEISYITVNPETLYANGIAKVTVEASDPDKDKLSYTYQVDLGTITAYGATAMWNAPGANNRATAIVVVTDGNGGETRAEAYLNTQGNATQISGRLLVAENVIGNLLYTKVSLYKNYDDWLGNIPFKRFEIGDEGPKVAYNMLDIPAGNYLIDFWKDDDYNGKWSYGDYVGWKGSGTIIDPVLESITVLDGQTTVCNIENMQVVSY
jgi:hypothetical protein